VDVVGTTMSGYTGGPVPAEPDLDLVRAAAARLEVPVVAEGRFNTPASAAAAIGAGAFCVVVGSAITRTEHVTGWFADAVAAAGAKAER
jgi:putative N-acetylmannosamine-6-phosphate epimerase